MHAKAHKRKGKCHQKHLCIQQRPTNFGNHPCVHLLILFCVGIDMHTCRYKTSSTPAVLERNASLVELEEVTEEPGENMSTLLGASDGPAGAYFRDNYSDGESSDDDTDEEREPNK